MRTKYFLIYVFVGIAFLAVSAWVFLSGGQNAKAIRAKYRLGGILIMAWAMISVASCSVIEGIIDGGGMVTCYDAVEPEPTQDIVQFSFVRNQDKQYNDENDLSPGDVVGVTINIPTYDKYFVRLTAYEGGDEFELQRSKITVQDLENKESVKFEVQLSEDITFRGAAQIWVQPCVYDHDGTETYGWINGHGNGLKNINII